MYTNRLEEAGEIHAAVKCYQEALADDPDLESPKRRLHYLEAQVFCKVDYNCMLILRVCLKNCLPFFFPSMPMAGLTLIIVPLISLFYFPNDP